MKPQKVLVLGSGALKIGEAGEFDYSGSQALKAFREEGLETILVNPNIATVQTSEEFADRVYFLPVTPAYVQKVIARERPRAVAFSFGGQTALNCGIALHDSGVLRRYGVSVLGTPIEAVRKTEDRRLFNQALAAAGIKTPRGIAVRSVEAGLRAADRVGYPVIARVAYALGGKGSGMSASPRQLEDALRKAFTFAPQVLVEEFLEGWKEVEYEVMRDAAGNSVTVCNMENFDPMGIHTGESIVVAPSQTLTNDEYHMLRELALRAVRSLGIVGECNIQFALNPRNGDYRTIEVNARLSRSSALASKATGYPIAFIAAKLMLGKLLPGLRNSVTGVTSACFEPALDYLAVKIPRWDLKKFARVSKKIGTEMKSVGEVMALGRSFEEAVQKAARMLQVGMYGLVANENYSFRNLEKRLRHPTDERLFGIAEALRLGWSVDRIHALTQVDRWFLYKIQNIVECASRLGRHTLASLPADLLLEAKKNGFSDKQVSVLTGSNEHNVRRKRLAAGIAPVVKQIDTLAAEYPARTNYLYLTYHGSEHDLDFGRRARRANTGGAVGEEGNPAGRDGSRKDPPDQAEKKIMILGSGSYSIGSSVEFDWCSVNTAHELRKKGFSTIMVNYNPETVSTDYDMCDRLYFDELSFERVLDIYELERPEGLILSMGGQIPNSLAVKCLRAGLRVLGTSPRDIDRAENRYAFSKLMDRVGVDQPLWKELTTVSDAKRFAREIGYPVLVRPSYVLSGAAMSIVFDERWLERYLRRASRVTPEYPVVISKFIMDAKEIEFDAVAAGGRVVASAIIEHVENAGVHSGDATMVLPPQRLYIETIRRIRETGQRIARALNITGPFNIQFIAKDNEIKVIECNLRASRSFPFVSKVTRVNLIELAVAAMLGERTMRPASTLDINYVGVKAPQFSFSRLKGADPVLGVEMASTGEVACLGRDVQEAFLKALISAGFTLPEKNILLSLGGERAKLRFLPAAEKLAEMGFRLFATEKTARFLRERGIEAVRLYKVHEKRRPNIRDFIRERKVEFVISVPNPERRVEFDSDYLMRRLAVDFSVPILTNLQVAELFVQSLAAKRPQDLEVRCWAEYR